MTEKMSRDGVVGEFEVAVRQYLALCESACETAADPSEFAVSLAVLCSLAPRLPTLRDASSRDEPLVVFGGGIMIDADLPDNYQFCYSPFRLDARPCVGSLADDLSDIYIDLKGSHLIFLGGEEIDVHDAVWEWRFSFFSHWGAHALAAQYYLHWLIRARN